MKSLRPCLISIFVLVLISQTAWAQNDKGIKRFGNWLKDDPVSLVKGIGSQELVSIGFSALLVGTVASRDETSSKNFQHRYEKSDFLSFSNHFGSKNLVIPFSAALFGTSLLTDNSKFQDASFTSFQSLAMTSLAVGAGKFLFARARPGDDDGAYDFDFAESGETSFPSGHTATAFALITPWIVYYPHPLTYSLFAIPVGTAIARVAKGHHWLSDVTAGAAIGFAMSYWLANKHLGHINKKMQITPAFNTRGASLAVSISL